MAGDRIHGERRFRMQRACFRRRSSSPCVLSDITLQLIFSSRLFHRGLVSLRVVAVSSLVQLPSVSASRGATPPQLEHCAHGYPAVLLAPQNCAGLQFAPCALDSTRLTCFLHCETARVCCSPGAGVICTSRLGTCAWAIPGPARGGSNQSFRRRFAAVASNRLSKLWLAFLAQYA